MSLQRDIHDTADSHRGESRNHTHRAIVPRLPFVLMGFSALLWVLVRVVPRPSRASYPCMRVSMPLATGFIVWLSGLFGSTLLVHRGKILLRERRRMAAGLCILLGVGAGVAYLLGQPTERVLAEQQVPNDPIGVAKGIYPGRVVWVHDASATDWLGPEDGHWWEPEHTDYAVVEDYKEFLPALVKKLEG